MPQSFTRLQRQYPGAGGLKRSSVFIGHLHQTNDKSVVPHLLRQVCIDKAQVSRASGGSETLCKTLTFGVCMIGTCDTLIVSRKSDRMPSCKACREKIRADIRSRPNTFSQGFSTARVSRRSGDEFDFEAAEPDVYQLHPRGSNAQEADRRHWVRFVGPEPSVSPVCDPDPVTDLGRGR